MKKVLPVLFLLLFQSFYLFSQSGIINTIAGNGVAGYSGDGGQATNAEFSDPFSVYVDGVGNVYFSDVINNNIRKISTSGIITTIAGSDSATSGYSGDGGPATAAELYYPYGICEDTLGNLFIADYYNHRIRRVSNSGIITTVAGNGVSGNSGDGGPATAAEMSGPSGVATDSFGNIYIADCVYSVIRKVTISSGIISTVAGNGTAGYSGDGGQATAAQIFEANEVTIDDSNNIYILDTWNDRIRKVEYTTGIITTIAGNGFDATLGAYCCDGGPATAAELYYPEAMSIESNGACYFADSYNSRIRFINPNDTITTVVGNGTAGFSGDGGQATDAELNLVAGVALDGFGNIYLSDWNNHRIRKVSSGISTCINQLFNNSQLSIYPNPAQNVIYVQVQGTAKVELLEVYTITGQKVYTSTQPLQDIGGASFSFAINTSTLPDGIYFLKVALQDGDMLVKKVEIIK